MARLNSIITTILNEEIINNLEAKKIITIFDFVLEKDDKLTKITKLSFKVSVLNRSMTMRNITQYCNKFICQKISELKQQISQQFGGKIKDPAQLLIEQELIISTENTRY